ncbi:hypothetical protein [Paracoccus yeei]|uniref:Uncharacterized protein n=1 Tax=Paracoccus yeei TaxID=147645 RepID=A0A2D2C227_9RHOB|nr:hypothetical protein [Paracoccus yeei]ATQ56561.1 hypothetical protein PYTT13_12665 [Paracoccus yeei]
MQAGTTISAIFSSNGATSVASGGTELTAMQIAISRRRDTYDMIDVTIVWPGATFWSSGFRYIAIRSSHDGVIAVGEIVGIPIAMAGAVVTVQAACRAADHSTKIATALTPARARLGKHLAPDDDEALLDICLQSLYVAPIGGGVLAFPFGGLSSRAVVQLYGEGSAVGASNILGLRVIMTNDPATAFRLDARARHVQSYTAQVAASVPNFQYYGVLERAVDGGDADHVPLGLNTGTDTSAGSATVTIRPPFTDPTTCAYVPAATSTAQKRSVTGADFRAAVTSRVQRDETAQISVNTNIGTVPGARSDASDEFAVADMTGVNYFDQTFIQRKPGGGSRTIKMRCGNSSAWLAAGSSNISSLTSDAVNGLIEIATRRALDHIYCVEMQVDVPAAVAIALDTRDRCRVNDVRLPGGAATGWVTGVNIVLSQSDSATITLLCPIVSAAPVTSGDRFTLGIGLTGGVIEVRGTLGAPAGYQPTKPGIFSALEAGDGDFFVQSVTVSDVASDNEAMFSQINSANAAEVSMSSASALNSAFVLTGNLEDYVKPPRINVSWKERQISEDAIDKVQIGSINVVIAGGITFV